MIFEYSITNAQGAQVLSNLKLYVHSHLQESEDAKKGKASVDFLWWAIHDGDELCKRTAIRAASVEIVKRAES
jgi:hypothetical protein